MAEIVVFQRQPGILIREPAIPVHESVLPGIPVDEPLPLIAGPSHKVLVSSAVQLQAPHVHHFICGHVHQPCKYLPGPLNMGKLGKKLNSL